MPNLRKMTAGQFARRLAEAPRGSHERRYAFFLGAGASRSSGIPTGGELVRDHWLPRLHKLDAPDRKDLEQWAKEELNYDPANPAEAYGRVMDRLFPTASDRQGEVEALCEKRSPGFGYAVLAQLVAREHGDFNMVLTTNFDDLIADALYLYTQARPLVIHHESLAPFIRPTRMRPLVVKLHGDHRLSPHNTVLETAALHPAMNEQAQRILDDRGLVFMGYGGGDQSILKLLENLPDRALPHGVYWVSASEPQNLLRTWLDVRSGTWVEAADFDRAMLLLRDAYDLSHPTKDRFDQIFVNYNETFEKLRSEIRKTGTTGDADGEKAALTAAATKAAETLPDGWAYLSRAAEYETSGALDVAERAYVEGLAGFPSFAPILSNYALFLKKRRNDFVRAEEMFKRAIDVEPDNPIYLGNYANLLSVHLKDFVAAEEFYKRAIDADAENTDNLGNYAGFLLGLGRLGEGTSFLARAFSVVTEYDQEALRLELHFYNFAQGPEANRSAALKELKVLLLKEAASPGWDFSRNIAQATAAGHPDASWLPKLAAVITEGAKLETLDEWPAWAAIQLDQTTPAAA